MSVDDEGINQVFPFKITPGMVDGYVQVQKNLEHVARYLMRADEDGKVPIWDVHRDRYVPGIITAGGGECGDWVLFDLINGWSAAGAPFDDPAYRLCPDGLQFKGAITGGDDDTIMAFLNSTHWPPFDKAGPGVVITPSGPGAADIYVSSVDGAVTITNIVVP